MARVDTRALEGAVARLDRELVVEFTRAMSFIGDSVANAARSTTLFKDRTGALRRSIMRGTVVSTPDRISVDVGAGGGRLQYARAVHDGSVPHIIRAKSRQALRFVRGGDFVFRRQVRHPGTRPRPFLDQAVEQNAELIERTMTAAAQLAFVRAGLA